MSLFVVAIELQYNCYHTFRILNDVTGEVIDMPSIDLFRGMTRGKDPIKVKHVRINYSKDTYRFTGCDDSRLCYIKDGQPRVNANGLVVTKIEGDYAYVANWKGQLLKAHQAQIASNVRQRKYVLTNADILPSGRIQIRPEEENTLRDIM